MVANKKSFFSGEPNALHSRVMKKLVGLLFLVAMLPQSVTLAQDAADSKVMRTADDKAVQTSSLVEVERTPTNIIRLDAGYVFASDLNNDGNFGEQDVLGTGFEFSHRFLLSGKFYLRAGVVYNRFDFGDSFAPVPDQLFSIAGLLGLEYMVGKDVGAFLQVQPGFYTESDIGSSSFDIPITAGRVFILQPDRLYLFVGVNVAFLRGEYPVLPLAGLVWKPTPQWQVYAVVPEPRITYSFNRNLDVFVGGQLVGGSFRTDRDDNISPHKLSNAQVDYSEYRAGLGIDFHPRKELSITLGGGYAFERRINFDRAGEEWKADGAPYVRAAFRAEF